MLFVAGAQDIFAQKLGLSVPTITWTFRVMVFVLPLLTALLASKLCHDLVRAEELERRRRRSATRWPGRG